MSRNDPPGRPPLRRGDPTINLSVRLPTSEFDQACHQASAERVSLSEWARRQLRRRLQTADEDDGDDDQ